MRKVKSTQKLTGSIAIGPVGRNRCHAVIFSPSYICTLTDNYTVSQQTLNFPRYEECGVLNFLWDSDSGLENLGLWTPSPALKTWTPSPDPDSESMTYCMTY